MIVEMIFCSLFSEKSDWMVHNIKMLKSNVNTRLRMTAGELTF